MGTPNSVFVDGKSLKQKSILGLATVVDEIFHQAEIQGQEISSLIVPVRRSNFTVTSLAAAACYVRCAERACDVIAADIQAPKSGCVFGDPVQENFLLNRTDEVLPVRVFSKWNTTEDGMLTSGEVTEVLMSICDGVENVCIDFPDQCSQAQFTEFLSSLRSRFIRLSKVGKYGGSLLDTLSMDSLSRKGLVTTIVPVETNTDCLIGWSTSLRYIKTHVSSKGAAALSSLFHLPHTRSGDTSYTAVLVSGGTVEPFGVGIRLQKALELIGHVKTFTAIIPKDAVMVDTILKVLSQKSVTVNDIKFLQGVSGPQFNTQMVRINCMCTLPGKFEEAMHELATNNVVIENNSQIELWTPP
ncbi:hypothetical protein GEMRC1_012381 [Eukaryota sp. GEM-RC1]